jgi:hypothetical protein
VLYSSEMRSIRCATRLAFALGLGFAACVGNEAKLPESAIDGGDPADAAQERGTEDAIGFDGGPTNDGAPLDASADGAPVCDPAVISIWHADGTAVDSLNGNLLEWSSPLLSAYTTGRRGKAFDFSTPAGATAADVAKNNAGGFAAGLKALTLSVWANPHLPGKASRGNLVTVAPKPGSAETIIRLGLGEPAVADANQTILQLYVNGQFREAPTTLKSNVADEWTHYAVTLQTSGTDLAIAFYLNGVLKDRSSVPGALPPMGTPNIRIGGTLILTNYQAALDEVAVIGRALSNEEVGALYASVTPASCP